MQKSIGFPDESIKPPAASTNSLAPALNYVSTKFQIKFDGSISKQDKVTEKHGEYLPCGYLMLVKILRLKKIFFWLVKLTKNSDPEKFKYFGCGIGFDARGSFSLSNGSGFVKNVIIFGANMSSLVHTDNKKKYILVLVKGTTDGLVDTMLTAEKDYSINFTEQFCLSFHYNGVTSYIFVIVFEIYNFKAKESVWVMLQKFE